MGEQTGKDAPISLLSAYKSYSIVTLVGPGHIYISSINAEGRFQQNLQETITSEIKDSCKRILRFKDDSAYKQGILILKDNGIYTTDFAERGGCKLYQFPLQRNESDGLITLSILKGGEVYELLKSSDPDTKCLAYDSYFNVVRANKDVFEKEKEKFAENEDSEDDAVRKAFSTKDYIKCVVITSDENRVSRLYGIEKVRDDDGLKGIINMKLIMEPENVKEIQTDANERED